MSTRDRKTTLDPSSWSDFRSLAHRMLDDSLDYLEGIREQPVWRPLPDENRAFFESELPLEGRGAEAAYEDFVREVMPYTMGNVHPRFWGWVMGNGTPLAMMADLLAAAINPNMGGGNHAPALVEEQVIHWCAQMMGFPPESTGLLTSGCSAANFHALAVARHRAIPGLREKGLRQELPPMAIYGSAEMHSSIDRAVELLGLGNELLVRIDTDARYKVDVDAMARRIRQDKERGVRPLAIVGCAGTVNCGACDPLDALADLAQKEGIWFHVDGAFGAMASLAPRYAELVSGLERADSLSFDLHKWGYMPFELGCVLVRHPGIQRETFSITPAYLKRSERGLAASEVWHSDLGLQHTRGFRALKFWLTLKAEGSQALGEVIEHNIDLAHRLHDAVVAHERLEAPAAVELGIATFRYVSPELSPEQEDELNEELMLRLQESGTAVFTSTILGGRRVLRAAITNHRSQEADVDEALQAVLREGAAIASEISS